MSTKYFVFAALVFPLIGNAVALDTQTRSYSITLGASRIIFDADSDSYNLPIENQQSYPILVESRVMDEKSEKKSPDYIVTPPLFRLDSGQKNTISIIKVSPHFPHNIESMHWICVKSIPPTEGSAWSDNDKNSGKGTLNVNVMVNSCIKLITRPSSLNIKDASYASALTWQQNQGALTVTNPTPYFINFRGIKVNGRNITPPIAIKPQGVYQFPQKNIANKGEKITWNLINDYGGTTRDYQTLLN
ncbi:molecular chaperone [Edwardsiella piscicida]|uniref:fimbrial biogenesis chaperone n=1 Tax=Edwardsiella piscicida TaxID=1263550 RepID=UPI00370D7602